MKTAIVIGATGLVGSALVDLLIQDSGFSRILVFSRRSIGRNSSKLEEHIIDFDQPENWKGLIKGDVLFSCLGTTLKQAGSREKQYQIDYTYQYQFAEAASENGVPFYVLVSSAGANPASSLFYSRIKGELERDVKALHFSGIHFLQPSLLHGKRKDDRFGEKFGYRLLKGLNAVGLFRKYRPIDGATVAKGMIAAALAEKPGVHTYTLDEIFPLARE